MLKALDLPLLKRYLVHGWWLNSGNKMSKSEESGQSSIFDTYGADAFRYFVENERWPR